MKYVCLGYIDESKFAATPPEVTQKMMDECFAYDDELRRGGHFIGGEALDTARNAVTLRTRDGEVLVTDGPFAETKEDAGRHSAAGGSRFESRDCADVEAPGSEDRTV